MKIAFVSLIAFCVLIGCNVITRPAQPLILFGEAGCGLGCWQGLHLGMTDAETAQYFVENLPEHYNRFEYEGTIYYRGVADFMVQAYTQDDALQAIFLGNGVSFDLTLQQVIEELGEPPFSFWDYDIATESPNGLISLITLYYPEQGHVFDLDLPPQPLGRNVPVTICPTPNIRVRDIRIVHPGTMESIIRDAYHFSQVERIMSNLVSWQGYECQTFEYGFR